MKFRLSTKEDCIGKSPKAMAGEWERASMTPDELLQFSYFEGKAIAPGLFRKWHIENNSATNKANEHWVGAELVACDIDDYKEGLFDHPFVDRYCFLAFPSSGYREDKQKYHLFFLLDEIITDPELYRDLVAIIGDQFGADDALSRPAQGLFGTEFLYYKGSKEDFYYKNPNAIKVPSERYIKEIKSRKHNVVPLNESTIIEEQQTDIDTISARAIEHMGQPFEIRERVTLEALKYALKGWGRKPYEKWFALIASAYKACNSAKVRNFIYSHEDIDWDEKERGQFLHWWENFTPKEGYTVATLFMFARENGWFRESDVEITDYEEFYSEEVGDWLLSLDPLPNRAIIMSNTGTGKTLGAIELTKKMGIPKTVFFAPTRKLCTALSTTLEAKGIENTLYIEGAKIKDRDTLREARVLVTTLQTFCVKVAAHGVDLSSYKLVFIDESDQLISAFSRANVGYNMGYGSHVTNFQAKWGFFTLRKMLKLCEYVFFLDATATKISETLMQRFSSKPVKVYKNTFSRRKAEVTILRTLSDARKVIIDNAKAGLKVVVACDTKIEAERIHEYLKIEGLENIILITGSTGLSSEVKQFFQDVELGATDYDVVIYNSAMGSGVSITQTKPDVIVQIANYISPRANLQILNRYRQNSKVYLYTPPSENVYGETVDERLSRVQTAIDREVSLIGIEPKERDEIAQTITEIALLAIRDELNQRLSSKDFYTALLEGDGRSVSYIEEQLSNEEFRASFKKVLEVLSEQKEFIRTHWRRIPPIDDEHPADEDYSDEDIALGLLHAYISRTIPEYDKLEISDREIAELVIKYGRYVRFVEHWLEPERALSKSVVDILSKDTSKLTFRLFVARLELLGLIGLLFEDETSEIDTETFDPHKFYNEIELRKDIYNTIAGRTRNSFEKVIKKKTDKREASLEFAKRILNTIGLTIRRKNGPRRDDGSRTRVAFITGGDGLRSILDARGNSIDKITFDSSRFYDLIKSTQDSAEVFKGMSKHGQERVRQIMSELDETFTNAVSYEEFMF